MRLSEAIEAADRIRPNVVDIEEKRRCLLELETGIAELMGETDPEWDYDTDDPELLIPENYAGVYIYWLLPFIDYIQEETDLYQLDAITANERLNAFKTWYMRTHKTGVTTPQIKGVFL